MRTTVTFDAEHAAGYYTAAGKPVTTIPLVVRQRERRKLLVPPSGAMPTMPATGTLDKSMVLALGRACYWQSLLDSGEMPSATALAKQLGLKHAWVSEVLRMGRLAPDITEAILDGRQPRHLNLQLIRRNVPVDWEVQRIRLGF